MRRHRRDLLRGVASAVTLVALVVAPPVILVTQVGWPLPTKLPSVDDIRFALTVGIENEVVINTLAVVGWLAWAYVAIATGLQVVAIVAGRAAHQLGGLPGLERKLGELVASATLAVNSIGSLQASSTGLSAVVPIVAVHAPAPAAGVTRPAVLAPDNGLLAPRAAPASPTGVRSPDGVTRAHRTVDVQRRDSYWGIAERELGSGLRWREIRDLNIGRAMPDGQVVAAGSDEVAAGWQLLLPASPRPVVGDEILPASPMNGGTPERAGRAGAAPAHADLEDVIVEAGDNMWSIAEAHLQRSLGRSVTSGDVAPYWLRFIEMNRSRFVQPDNPNLIYPGQVFQLPSVDRPAGTDVAVPSAPPADPVTVDPGAESRTGSPGDSCVASPVEDPAERIFRLPGSVSGNSEVGAPTSDSSVSQPLDDGPSSATDHADAPTDSSLVAQVAGVAVGLAGLVVLALSRRRRQRRRLLDSGTVVDRRVSAEVEAERVLAVVSTDVLGRVQLTSRLMSSAFRDRGSEARVLGLVVRPDGDVTIYLSEPVVPPESFRPGPSGLATWLLPAETTEIPDDASLPPALESVVTLGRTTDGDWVFVDIESLGAVSIDGPEVDTSALARSIVAELALQPVDHYVDLTVVGCDVPALSEQGVAVADRLDDSLVREIERTAAQTADYLDANSVRSTTIARCRGVPRDGLVATVVVVGEANDPVLLSRMAEAALPGGLGVGVVAVGADLRQGTHLAVAEDGRLRIPHLGLTVRASALDVETLQAIDGLIEHEPVTAASDDIIVPEPVAVIGPYEAPPWRLCVRVFADLAVERPDGERLSFIQADNPSVRNKNSRRGPELLAYLALRPDRTATLDDIRSDLWWGRPIGDRSADTLVSGTRKLVGGPDVLTYARDAQEGHRYYLSAAVVTDVDLLRHALSYARDASSIAPDLALAALRPHLGRIEAPAFRDGYLGAGLADWAAATRACDEVEQPIVEAALLVAGLLTDSGPEGQGEALVAVDRALRACPMNEALTRAAMELESYLGDRDAANSRYQALAIQLARDDYEPEEATTELRQRIMSTSHLIGDAAS